MNITELRYIIEIAQCGSVSAASKRLYVAQPNISKAIRSLGRGISDPALRADSEGNGSYQGRAQFIARRDGSFRKLKG